MSNVVITEVRLVLMGGDSDHRLRAYASVALDDMLVIHDLRVIEGPRGLFVAMPCRKLADGCPFCNKPNHLRAHFCNHCKAQLDANRALRDDTGRMRLYVDVVHPICHSFRAVLEGSVLDAYHTRIKGDAHGGDTHLPAVSDADCSGGPALPADAAPVG